MPRLRPIHFILVGAVVVILTAGNGSSTERGAAADGGEVERHTGAA